MTILEIQTRMMEVMAELQTNEQHSAAIREQIKELITELGEGCDTATP